MPSLLVRTSPALLVVCWFPVLHHASAELAGQSAPAPTARLRPSGIDGALVIAGGGKIPDSVLKRFVELAGGDKARLVICPTASAQQPEPEKLLAPWKAFNPASVTMLHASSRKLADEPSFVEPLRQATGIWFEGGRQDRLADTYVGTAFEQELYALQKRGGVVGGTSAGAAALSRLMIASGNPEAKTMQGFDALPGAVIDQHFLKRNRKPRLTGVVDRNRGMVGVGIDEGTALVVQGREMRVLGESTVTLYLAPSQDRPAREIELKPGSLSDWTMWRRAALARTLPAFPPKEVSPAELASGSLVIVGGGGMPPDVTKKFIELAGGPDALIVILPTANPDPLPPRGEENLFTRAGARNVKVLPARELKDVEDPRNLDILKQARGVWFGGGRQWRFVDAYEGTRAEELFRDVLRRGGVIGGSSAGATIQGEYLSRGSPLGNLEMMCEGYERGLRFLPGTVIDQHFTQRKRHADMTALMKTHPQLLGIGLDEGTALIVKGHEANVMGRGKAHFYDRRKPVESDKPDYEALEAGDRYDLKERKTLSAPR